MIKDPVIENAIQELEKKTGHPRFRLLCDPDSTEFNPMVIPAILAMAGVVSEAPPRAAPSVEIPARKGCGCGGKDRPRLNPRAGG